jgi:hypothetical protein
LVFWTAAAVLAVNLGRLVYNGWRPLTARAASGRPYTVVRTENGYDKGGSLKYTIQYVEALRTDGSTMWRATTPIVQQRRIHIAYGDKILTNEPLARKSTYPKFFAQGAPLPREPTDSCLIASEKKIGWIVDGSDSIGGNRTVRLVYAGPKYTIKAWHALDAACALLQQSFEDDSGRTVQTLASLVLGEPNAGLFQVPATFQEVPPSRLHDPICTAGGSCTSPPEEIKQRMDNKYLAVRANTP